MQINSGIKKLTTNNFESHFIDTTMQNTCSTKSKLLRERLVASITLIIVIISFFAGLASSSKDVIPFLNVVMPNGTSFKNIGQESYAAYNSDSQEHIVGYISVGQFDGFGGPMKVITGVDTSGNITKCAIIEHRETFSWYRRVVDAGVLESFSNKSCQDQFELGNDIDGISGATYTCLAISESVKQASHKIGRENLQFDIEEDTGSKFSFGFPEIALLLLFLIGFLARNKQKKYLKKIRWFSLISSMVILGFVINYQLTIVDFTKLFMGYWPNFYNHIYWYLLVWGVVLIFTFTGKNVYCQWICPFGAAQECIGAIGKAKVYSSNRYGNFYKWLRWGIVWIAVVVAFVFRNPGLTSYEVYVTLFDLSGTNSQFILLIVVLTVALLIKRPWCNYLCPIPVFQSFAGIFRGWTIEIVKSIKS